MPVQQPIDTKHYWQEYQEFYRVKQRKNDCKSTKKNWNHTILSRNYLEYEPAVQKWKYEPHAPVKKEQ